MSYQPKSETLSVEACLALSKKLVDELQAEAGVIASLNIPDQKINILCGIFRSDGILIYPSEIDFEDSPLISSSMKRGKSFRLMDASRHPELNEWGKVFNDRIVSLMLAPLPVFNEIESLVSIMIKTEDVWQHQHLLLFENFLTENDLTAFEPQEAALPLPTMGSMDSDVEEYYPDNGEIEISPPIPRSEIETLSQENLQQKQDIERLLTYIDKLDKNQEQYQNGDSSQVVDQTDLIENLQIENEQLKFTLTEIEEKPLGSIAIESNGARRAKEELRLALLELSHLQNLLRVEQESIDSSETAKQDEPEISSEKSEKIAAIAQEMRQPLSSILGYTDLLLGESVGILGALQRNFLERVHKSSERMDSLIVDLVNVAELDNLGIVFTRKAVDLNKVIDEAIAKLREQLQEKEIILHVDMPPLLPELETDEDALQQIFFHLLQNANAATPVGGEITLRAYSEEQKSLEDFALIQISDSGGGIAEEDIPKVFSRKYRAQNPAIQGIGDLGVGLTIAETLTTALGGRIWVESQPGEGATFSILLPRGGSGEKKLD